MNEKVRYWIDIAEYDYDTALAMMKSKRYLYVGFMCHQVIEKMLKAYFNSIFDTPAPFTHNLSNLAQKTNIYELLSEDFITFIDFLEPLNIEARYPEHKEKLLKSLSFEKCEWILKSTKDLQLWIKEKLLIN